MRGRRWSARCASTPDPLKTIMNMAPDGWSTYSSEALLASQISRAMYKPKTRAARRGGEERLEQMWPDGFRHSRPVIGDGQFYSIRRLASAY